MKRYVVEQLEAIYRSHARDQFVVLTPTRQIGRNLEAWLADSGTSHVNIRFEEVALLARRLVESDTSRALPDYASRDQRLLAAAAAIRQASSAPDFYFGTSTGPGFVRVVERTLSTLREGAVTPRRLSGSPRIASVGRLLEEYTRVLDELQLSDDADLFRLATDLIRRRKGDVDIDVLCILGEVGLSSASESMLSEINPRHRYRVGLAGYEHTPAGRTASLRLADWPLAVEGDNPWRIGIRLGGGPDHARDDRDPPPRLRVVTAPSPEREVEGILADIVASGRRWDECELAYTSADYLSTIESVAGALEIPCSFARGRSASGTAPGQALIAFYEWIRRDLVPGALEDLLRSRCIRFKRSAEADSKTDSSSAYVRPDQVADQVRMTVFGSGHEAYSRSLRGRGERDQLVESAGRALDELLALVRFRVEEPFGVLAEAGIRLLDQFVANRSERDRAASTSLKERLTILAGSTLVMPVRAASALMIELLSDHHFETSAAREGGLYVTPLESSGYAGREYTFIVGLDEHVFPGSTHEDPVLLDDDRTAISSGLPLRHGDAGARIWSLERALLAAGDAVTLVGRNLDLIYGKHIALTPAVVTLLERRNLLVESYGLVETAERSLSNGSAVLSQRDAMGYGELVDDYYPWLKSGRHAALSREGVALNEYSGFLGRATPELSIRGERVFSASALERLAACPYRYFLRDVLRIRKIDDPVLRPGQWLEPREFGSLLHELLRRFMTRLGEAGERAATDHHEGMMVDLLDEVVAEKLLEKPAPGAAALEHDRRRLERSALIFLRNEARMTAQPFAFELSFGSDDEEPLEIQLGEGMTLRLRGMIDRVDRARDGYEVWDYKSGSMAPFAYDDLATTSGHLQWMLYAYAFEDLRAVVEPGARVVRSGYLFVSDREQARRHSATVPERSQLAEDLRPLAEMTEAGAFLHYQRSRAGNDIKKGACRFCDYNEICWRERRTASDLDALDVFERESPVGRALGEWLK